MSIDIHTDTGAGVSAGGRHPLGPSLPAPGEIHLIEGRHMHLQRSGPWPAAPGQATIVIEAGAGAASPAGARLQRMLAARYPVVSYDRPGLGWSQADPQILDGRRNATRLHALLSAAGVDGPIVFIGSSMGGLLARVYTQLYPQQVLGMLMLDASPPQLADYLEADLARLRTFLPAMRAELQAHIEGGPQPPWVSAHDAWFEDMPEAAQQMQAICTPESIDTNLLEAEGMMQLARQAAVSDLGARPLTVLWAPVREVPPDDASAQEISRLWPLWQRQTAALSTRGRVLSVEGADHASIGLLPKFVARVAQEVDLLMAQLG